MFDSAVYAARRAALARALTSPLSQSCDARGPARGAVLFLGSRESPINFPDNCYPFRQDSSFLYFIGVAAPNLAALIDLAKGETTLYGDDATIDDIVWTGPVPAIAELAARSCIRAVRPRSALAADLAGSARRGELHYFPPYRADSRAEIAELAGIPYSEVNARASTSLIAAAVGLREIKSAEEIAEIERAVAVSVGMHRAAIAAARPGMLEAEVYSRVAQVALASGGGLSFPVIATTRGATLHTHSRDRRLEHGDLFLLDAGAEAPSGYAGDLTSSFPVGPRFDDRQRAAYELVLGMQRAAIAALKPGVNFREAHLAAAREGVVGLAEFGLMSGDPDEAVESGAYAFFFP
jgi:Xaa-Pro aminopeptidase